MFVSSRTFYGGDSQIPQTISFDFPFAERVEVYTLDTNATKWELQGYNGSAWIVVDSQNAQFKLYPSYKCSNPGSYTSYRFVAYQVGAGNKLLYVNSMVLTNEFRQVLHPNLTTQTKNYTCVPSGPSPLTVSSAPTNGSGTTAVSFGPTYVNSFVQSVIGSNVVCAHIRYSPHMNFTALVGSINGGTTWANVLAVNSTVSSNLTPFNAFRLVGDMGQNFTKFEVYDPNGNLVNALPNPNGGGAYRGLSNTSGLLGEWVDLIFDSPIAANVYEFSTTGTNYPTSWSVLGSNLPNQWNILHSVSNVYDRYNRYTHPFSQGSIPYQNYRLAVSSYQGRSSVELLKINLFDDRGYELVPRSSNVQITSNTTPRPTNVLGLNITTSPSTSPFIENQVFVSTSSNGQFSITLPTAVSVHKIYADTNSTFSVVADQTDAFQNANTILQVNTLTETNVYSTANTLPFRCFRFQNITQNKYMSNVAMFNRDGGRINPYLSSFNPVSSFNTVSSNVYGGKSQSSVSIQLTMPDVSANAYSIQLNNQSLASWRLEANVNGTWQIMDQKSNVYNGTPYYQSTFPSRNITGARLLIDEIAPHKNKTFSTAVNNLNILGNSYTLGVPYLTQNTFTVGAPGPLASSIPGTYKIRSSTYSSPPYYLFDDKPDTLFYINIPQSTQFYTPTNELGDVYGEWFEVETPFPVSARYFTFTTTSTPNRAPTSWILVGSQDRGSSWSNVLSTQTRYFTSVPGENQTNVFPVSNTTAAFTNFRFIILSAYNDSVCSLRNFSIHGDKSKLVPTFSTLDAPANYYAWSTFTDTTSDIFGGSYIGNVSTNIYTVANQISNVIPGEWIQIKFPTSISPSYLRLSANILPTNIVVCASNSDFKTSPGTDLSYIVGNVQYNFNQTRNITIPITVPSPMQYYRIIANEMLSNSSPLCGRFTLSEVSFLNSRMNKMHQNFTTSAETDPLNQTYVVTEPAELGGVFQENPEFLEANLFPSFASSNSYVFRSPDAKRWVITASTDYVTWDTLDTRELDEQITTVIPRAYTFYYQNQTGKPYSWYKISVTHTFKTIDGKVRIIEFAPFDYKRDRVIKYATSNSLQFSNVYSGGSYNGSSYLQTMSRNYYGEYKTFTYDRPTHVSNISLTFDQNASIKGITFLGKNDEQFWNVIPVVGTYSDEESNISDKTITGTYAFSGNTISNFSNAFTTSPFCIFSRNVTSSGEVSDTPYVQIELPVPTFVNSYEMSIPSRSDIEEYFSLPYSWTVQGSLDGVAWTQIHSVVNDLLLQYNSSYVYPLQLPGIYKYYKFTITAVNGPYTSLIKQITLFNGSVPIYLPKIFTREKNIQLVESPPLYRGPYKLFEFVNPVVYSNIAFVVNKFTSDPYASSGKLDMSATLIDFVPGKINYSTEYNYKPTDIVSGNAQSIVFYNDSSRYIKPSGYSFKSNTVNVWSVSLSQDGKIWNDVDTNVSGSKSRTIVGGGPPSSWVRLTVDKITNLTDGTVDVSEFKIYEDVAPLIIWPPSNMIAPTLVSNSILQIDSYGISFGRQVIKSSITE